MNVSSFSRNKPVILETFVVLFAKVIDMTILYILIIFYIKKIIPRSIWNFSAQFRKKGKEPIRYMVVRKKYSIHPKISGQAKTFWREMLAHLQGISPSAGGTPCQLKKKCFWQKCLYVFLCIGDSICIGQRLCFSHIQDFFHSLSEMEVGHIL